MSEKKDQLPVGFMIMKRMWLWSSIALPLLLHLASSAKYEPTWESIDSRPLPAWFDEGKFGIFIHWGVFSVPAFGSEWFWWYWQGQKQPAYINYMQSNYRPDFTYADFAPMFHAEFFNPDRWADIFQAAGAKYVVFVSKHHEGFTNWPSKYSFNWNAMDVGPNRDIVGDLADAVRSRTDIKFGLYHSLFEWFNPLFLRDKASGFRTQDFVQQKTLPELYEIVTKYRPEVIWSDGDWMALDTYWNSTDFLAWLYNESPVKDTVVVNDRWGNNTRCKHGGYWDCHDHYQPTKLVPHKWENCMTIDKYSWGYRANAPLSDYHTIEELLQQLAYTISLGGNVLFNIGPTATGMIPPIYEERLRQLGSWLKVNGEAIYKTHIWTYQNDSVTPDAWYTASSNGDETVVYAILLSWPKDGNVALGFPIASSYTTISWVGHEGYLAFQPVFGGGIVINLPVLPDSALPCKWAWVLRMRGLENQETKVDWKAFSRKVQSIHMSSQFN